MSLTPWRAFAKCPEPVDHGRVLRFLATLRLPLWVVLMGWLLVIELRTPGFAAIEHRSVHTFVDAQLARVLSAWLLIMVPVGLPLLYFSAGLLAHVGIGLTGGAGRSPGATMRAVGFALGPALLAVTLLDLPLHLGALEGTVYFTALGIVTVLSWALAAIGVGRTHRISLFRGVLVTILPMVTFFAVTSGRAALDLRSLPGVPAPQSPYYIP